MVDHQQLAVKYSRTYHSGSIYVTYTEQQKVCCARWKIATEQIHVRPSPASRFDQTFTRFHLRRWIYIHIIHIIIHLSARSSSFSTMYSSSSIQHSRPSADHVMSASMPTNSSLIDDLLPFDKTYARARHNNEHAPSLVGPRVRSTRRTGRAPPGRCACGIIYHQRE